MQKGTKIPEETRKKMSRSALLRDNTNRIAALPRGGRHWNWSAEPTVLTLHKRLYRAFGKARDKRCYNCGGAARDWSKQVDDYSDNISDYVPRCRSCHVKHDYSEERREKTRKITEGRKRDNLGRLT
jgi:hypothetical protein